MGPGADRAIDPSRSLSGRAVSAAKWSYAGNGARALGQLLIGVVLARILGPSAFGIAAIAWLMMSIGKLVADFGFGATLVQRSELSDRDIRFALTIQLALASFLALLGFVLAPLIAGFFREPAAAAVIRVMSAIFVVQAIAQTATALLMRKLAFRSVQLANVATYFLGYLAVGIPLAISGGGVWSLVAAQVVQIVSYALIVLWLSKLKLRLAIRPDAAGLFRFGTKVVGANVASWLILNLDSAVVGRVFGAAELGVYNRSMTLVSTPTATVTTSLQSVLFAACSRAQHDVARIRSVYLGVAGLLALATVPVFTTLALVAETAVVAVYGSVWRDAAGVLVPLALAMPVHALLAIIGPVLMSMDRTALEVRAQWITVAAMFPLLGVAAEVSLEGIAWAVLGTYALRLSLLVRAIGQCTRLSYQSWLRVLGPALIIACAVAAPTWLLDRTMRIGSPVVRLLADVALAGTMAVVALRYLGAEIAQGPMGAVLRAVGVPPLVSRWLRLS